MKKLFGGLAIAALALSVHAEDGRWSYVGQGKSRAVDPEWVSVQITVQSECFKSPRDARAANDQTVLAVQKYLDGLKYESKHDGVCTEGGSTRPFSRSSGYGEHEKIECKGTFQKTTTITFKTADLKNFSTKFDGLQEEILKSYASEGEGNESPRTFASIGTPSADISEQTRKELRLEALANAQDDAQLHFSVLAQKCKIEGSVSMTHESQPSRNYSDHESMAYSAPKSFRGGHEAVNVDFGPITESWSLPVTFIYHMPTFQVCALK